jgi:hypothetical protein
MNSVNWGAWIGAIAGGLFGVLGGALGTYLSIKNTHGPRERAFMIRASMTAWLLVAVFLVGLWLIPGWYRFLLWIPYVPLLIWGVLKWNSTQARIRREESAGQS